MSKARDEPKLKIGAGHAEAFFRQGLSELRGAFYNESNVAQPPTPGLYGVPTQGEVASARSQDERDAMEKQALNEEPRSIVGERLQQAENARDVRGRESRDFEKE